MKAKWMVPSAAAALCLVALAVTAQAKERRVPEAESVTAGSADGPSGEVSVEADDAPETDELDLLLAADAGASGDRGGNPMRRGPGAKRLREWQEQLNLSDEQKSRLADIRDRRARAAIPIQGDLRVAGLDMRKLMRADRPDRQAIDAQIDRIADLRAQLQKSRVAGLLDARAVLTPAQQKLMREHQGMGGRGRHGRMDFMDDPMARPRR